MVGLKAASVSGIDKVCRRRWESIQNLCFKSWFTIHAVIVF